MTRSVSEGKAVQIFIYVAVLLIPLEWICRMDLELIRKAFTVAEVWFWRKPGAVGDDVSTQHTRKRPAAVL